MSKQKYFEITANILPYEVIDEGIEVILHRLKTMAGCNAASIYAASHGEKRPFYQSYFPHNSKRNYIILEDGVVYFPTNEDYFKGTIIKPKRTKKGFMKDKDIVQIFIDGCKKFNIHPQVELPHTYIDEERIKNDFPNVVQRNIFNEPFLNFLCWNNDDARNYAAGIAENLVSKYDFDTLMMSFECMHPGRLDLNNFLGVTLGGCFCENCEKRAIKEGLDWKEIKKTVKKFASMYKWYSYHWVFPNTRLSNIIMSALDLKTFLESNTTDVKILLENPLLFEWLKFRTNCITEFHEFLFKRIKAIKPQINIRYNTEMTSKTKKPEATGQSLFNCKEYIDSLRLMDYSEQIGTLKVLENKRKNIFSIKREVGENIPIISAIGVRPNATIDTIRNGIRIAVESGVEGISIGFHDGATFERLKAIKLGLIEAGK